ncbi:MAG TPA: hypothetical protein VF077_05685 [Nitrospiraceae bacterium]
MSGYSVQVKHDDFPDGTEFSVPGLAVTLVNGKTASVDDAQAEEFKARTGETLLETFKDKVGFSVKTAKATSGGDS